MSLSCRDQGELGAAALEKGPPALLSCAPVLCSCECFTELLTGRTSTELRMDHNNFGMARPLFLCLPVSFISTIHSFVLTLFRMNSLSIHLESLSDGQWNALKLYCHNATLVAFKLYSQSSVL